MTIFKLQRYNNFLIYTKYHNKILVKVNVVNTI